MPGSSTEQDRPTLPGIREMLSDLTFESLQRESPRSESNAQPSPPPPPFVVPPRHGQEPRRPHREPCFSSTPAHSPPPLTASLSDGAMRAAPSPAASSGHELAGRYFSNQLPARGGTSPRSLAFPYHTALPNTRGNPSHQALQQYPTYILTAEECPPDDDRRHGCGICHRRFNRPSSLLIHMNSHTGAQPFQCPYPGCTRRFSVNSNMRRHYRNHRDAAPPPPGLAYSGHAQAPYPPMAYRSPDPATPPTPYYALSASPSAASSYSSFTDGSDDVAVSALLDGAPASPRQAPAGSPVRSRSQSDTYPARGRALVQDEAAAARRQRACTIPGCNCLHPPATLRPAAFQRAPAASPSPSPSPPSPPASGSSSSSSPSSSQRGSPGRR